MKLKTTHCLIFIVFLFLLYSVVSIVIGIAINSDSANGFLVLKSFENGAQFNHILSANPGNIAETVSTRMTWWSPGQWVVPAFFKFLFHCSLGYSASITVILATLIGFAGLYFLYKELHFDRQVILISLVIVIGQRYVNYAFNVFNGGNILMFMIQPWAIYGVLRFYKSLISILFLIFISMIGIWLKYDFLVTTLALSLLILVLKWNDVQGSEFRLKAKIMLFQTLILTISFAAIYIFAFIFFFQYGSGITARLSNFEFKLGYIICIFTSPLLGAFSIDNLIDRLFYFPGYETRIQIEPYIFCIPFTLLLIFIIIKIIKAKSLRNDYKILLFSFSMVYIVLFTFCYLFKILSFEITFSRYLRILGLILVPLIVKFIFETQNKKQRYFLWSLIMFNILFGVVSFIQRSLYEYRVDPLSAGQFRHKIIDKETLDYLNKLDKVYKNAVFYVTSPEIALEIKNNNYIASQADFEPLSFLQSVKYHGKVEHLFVFVQKKFSNNGKLDAIFNSFQDYSNKDLLFESDNFYVYSLK